MKSTHAVNASVIVPQRSPVVVTGSSITRTLAPCLTDAASTEPGRGDREQLNRGDSLPDRSLASTEPGRGDREQGVGHVGHSKVRRVPQRSPVVVTGSSGQRPHRVALPLHRASTEPGRGDREQDALGTLDGFAQEASTEPGRGDREQRPCRRPAA